MQGLFRFLHLLDGELLVPLPLQFFDAGLNVRDLLLQQALLPFLADRDFLKLRMADDDRIIVSRRYAAAKLLAGFRLKVFSRGHKDVG